MWAAAGIVGVLVGAGLIWWSVALGFTFFVLPIVVSEFLLLGALYLLRKALCTDEDPRENQREWQTASHYPLGGQRQDRGRAGDTARVGARRRSSRHHTAARLGTRKRQAGVREPQL